MTVLSTRKSAAAPPERETSGFLYLQAPGHPRPGLADRLSRVDVAAIVVSDVAEALRVLAGRSVLCGLIDLASERAALTAVRLLRARHPTLPLVGVADPANAVAIAGVVQAGVVDILPWPLASSDLATLLEELRDHQVVAQSGTGQAGYGFAWFLGSTTMRPVLEAARAAAAVRDGVAVCGERGSGRAIVARAIHALGGGDPETFALVDCTGRSPEDLERQLFGANAGRPQSSAASNDLVGPGAAVLQAGRGGTLFLHGLVDVPSRLQARLARMLRDREVTDDSGRTMPLALRLVASFDDAPETALADGRVRADLVDRLVTRIDVPPLRNRRDDVPRLAVHYLREACFRQGMAPKALSRSALTLLGALPWPRNTLDLVDMTERLVHDVRGPLVRLEDVLAHAHFDGAPAPRADAGGTLREARMRFERECISAALVRYHGRVGEAAKALGIQRTNLYRKVRQLKVDKSLLSARRG
jgi:DNA-binding NtrC family response regulator